MIAASFESPYWFVLGPLALVGALLTAIYVGRALGLLWRGERESDPVAGMGWMTAGLATLVVLAATLGFAEGPLARLAGSEVPQSTGLAVLSLALALSGLAVGWFVPASKLLGPVREAAETGFRVGGGFDGLVGRPRTRDGAGHRSYGPEHSHRRAGRWKRSHGSRTGLAVRG